MSRPTHFTIRPDGVADRVFPDGYPPEMLHELPADYWDLPRIWDTDAQEWREDLAGERARIWGEVKAQRAAITSSGCMVPGLDRVQTDPASLAAIEQRWGAAQADPEHWSAVWTMEDNSREPVDHAAMRAIKLAVDAHVDAVRAAADEVYSELVDEGVTTLAQLYEIPSDLDAILTA
jgi:hypothetical protein